VTDGDKGRAMTAGFINGLLLRKITPRLFVLALLLLLCPKEGHAQQEAFDREGYYSAVEYCRGTAPRPMALSSDQQILCFDGWVESDMDVSLASGLKENGLFVVRSFGGSIISAIALSDLLRERRATVVIYDYCLSACASYFFIASIQTYVLKGSLVAWHNEVSGLPDCASLAMPRDSGPKKLRRFPCPGIPFDALARHRAAISAETRFYAERTVDRLFEEPPDSIYVRKILKNMYQETGVYPDVAWTWNPRHHETTFKTKIYYEAYPESQEEVDAMVVRLHLRKVIYDP
jgi:hypothetical protein